MSIFRRVSDGRSPFSPDNEHLHNRLFRQVRDRINNPVIANSLTGLLVSGSTSGVTLLGYLQAWWPISGNGWLIFFGAEVVLYLTVYWAAGLTRKVN
jgi:hypothetical protein